MLLVVNMCDDESCFTYLHNTLTSIGAPFRVVTTIDEINEVNDDQITAIIISGSPIRLTQPANLVTIKRINVAVYAHASNPCIPILGICFGFQLLNVLYGGKVEPFGRLVCDRYDDLEYCFNDIVSKLGRGFQITKSVIIDGKKVTCGIHKCNITGYLFHSEATGNDKYGYIQRWVKANV